MESISENAFLIQIDDIEFSLSTLFCFMDLAYRFFNFRVQDSNVLDAVFSKKRSENAGTSTIPNQIQLTV